MTEHVSSRCPLCQGETIEIRAKLICRGCGTILETCCEGGPMGTGIDCQRPPSSPASPARPDDSFNG